MENVMGIITFLGGGFCGSLLTLIVNYVRGKLQIMECQYIEDDILSKVPQVDEENNIQQNLYVKKFLLKNTTNQDIREFKVLFQFDVNSVVKECYSRSKEGYNKQKIRKSNNNNEAEAYVRNFNRGDKIEYCIQIANVEENRYYITECKSMGFKIKCKDKRKNTKKSKSEQSNTVLVAKH